MRSSLREGKLFIFFSALWGISEVVGGYLLLLTVDNFWGDTSSLATVTSIEVATSLSFITTGKLMIAFAYFRGNALRLAVLISSILSIIAAVCLFLPLVTSAETHIHCEGAIECFTLLSINFNAIFLFFLTKRNQTTSEYEEVVEDMDVPPPPYEVAILHSNDQEGLEATTIRPMNTHPGGSPNQANINYACI